MFTTGSNVPQLTLNVDRDQAARLDVRYRESSMVCKRRLAGRAPRDFSINNHLSIRWWCKNEMQWREQQDKSAKLYVRNHHGERIRLSNLVTVTPPSARRSFQRYNQFPSVSVSGSAAQGVSNRTAWR